ncbi:MAG: uracil-DNA glycosylase [Anaerolineae bacterium]|nr:uracil-DNA glycosylase [Anaerolineae bacterium]
MDPFERLREIGRQVSVCDKCVLKNTRKRAVPGEGPVDAEIMLIGEGPGFHENEQGRPFVGAAGQFLNELLKSSGLTREKVFITNVVKCRPPGNRDPLPDELAACAGYLDRQIEIINPKVIITLGRYSMARYFPMGKISLIHGQASWVNDRMVVAMYHPAAALHQSQLRPILEADFSRLSEWLNQVKVHQAVMSGAQHPAPVIHKEEAKPPKEPPGAPPTQLSLF